MTNELAAVATNATIRAEMARRNLRQSAIAEALDVSQAQVSARLGGRVDWKLAELRLLASLFGLPVSALVDAEPVPAADAGHAATQLLARVLFVLAVALVAGVIGWNAPAGTPVAVLLMVGAFYTLARLLAAGALAAPRRARGGAR